MKKALLVTFALLGWVVAAVEFVGVSHPGKLPIFDREHFGISAHNETEVRMWTEILSQGGLKLERKVELGPTIQYWFSDGRTVVNMMNPAYQGPATGFPGNYISMVVSEPQLAAKEVFLILQKYRDNPEVAILPIPDSDTVLAAVASPRLQRTIVFRRHAMRISKKAPGTPLNGWPD